MKIAVTLIALYSVAVLYLATRVDRSKKNRRRLTGRGGDFES